MSAKLCIANWKMNGRRSDWRQWALACGQKLNETEGVEIVLCPPFPGVVEVYEHVKAANRICVGAQDVTAATETSRTGDVNAPTLLDCGCEYVIVGHSERRAHHEETNATTAAKAAHALYYGLKPIVCVGENSAERSDGRTIPVLDQQLLESLKGLEPENAEDLVIAYEPVWSIGTGKAATAADLAEPLRYLRAALIDRFANLGHTMRIVYGGSVNATNAQELKQLPLDGVLVGGASLKVEEFRAIVMAFGQR